MIPRPISKRCMSKVAIDRSTRGACTSRPFSSTNAVRADFTHAVIGGGAVGLAIARRLAARDGTSTLLVERNSAVGMETSSRNSEVIHAGLYYGPDSLKTSLCIKGREMLYALCAKHNIPHSNTGKWIVAQDNAQWEELTSLHQFTKSIGVPTRFVPLSEAAKKEPSVRAKAGILESPTTGIVDSHAYMQFLLGEFQESGGDVAYNSTVTSINPPNATNSDFIIQAKDRDTGEENSFSCEVLINSAGLGACDISNMLLPEHMHIKPMYAKGNYFSYNAKSPSATRLIYPAPVPGHGGLGTHLTLDLEGHIRFGPDVEWVDDPSDVSVTVDPERMKLAIEEIRTYFPDVDADKIVPDYAGIRPKLGKASATVGGKGFMDFVCRREDNVDPLWGGRFVNLLGIESPGLTSSLALGERVEDLIYR